jgi:DNA-directed RNA polymerase specialized sigma24 family protein
MDITEEINDKVFRRCNSAMKGDYLADDVAQAVLIKLWRYADCLNDKLLKILISHAISDLNRVFLEDIDDYADTLPDEREAQMFDKLRGQFEQIKKKIKLTRKQRSVLSLVLKDIPYTKACKMVGVDHREYGKMISKFREVLADV